MISTFQAMLPKLLTGNSMSINKFLSDVKSWSADKVNSEFDSIPERYNKIFDNKMDNYTALMLYTDIISLFRESNAIAYKTIIAEAQKRALHYHNAQLNKNESNNSKLSQESKNG